MLFDPHGYVRQERGRERPGEAPAFPSAHSLLRPSREGRGTFYECLLDPLGRPLPSSQLRRGWGTFCECLLDPLGRLLPSSLLRRGWGLSVNVYFTPFRYQPLPPLCELAAASVWGRGGRRVSSLPPRGQREGLGVPSQEGARRAPRGTLYRKVTKVVSLQSPVYLAVQ